MTQEEVQILRYAVNTLESATDILEDEDIADAEGTSDAREAIDKARQVLQRFVFLGEQP